MFSLGRLANAFYYVYTSFISVGEYNEKHFIWVGLKKRKNENIWDQPTLKNSFPLAGWAV